MNNESLLFKISQKTKLPINIILGFSFLIVAGIIGLIYYSINQKLNYDYLENPQVGDYYAIDMSVGSQSIYTLYKVKEVRGDSVYVLKSEYTIDKLQQIGQLEDKPFEKISSYYLKTELNKMFDNGKLKDIRR